MLDVTDEGWLPDYDDLVAELKTLRKAGVGALRRLHPPLLNQIARHTGLTTNEVFEPSAIEELLRRAADTLGGGIDQDATEFLFGLAPGWKMRSEGERRTKAADIYAVLPDSFRKAPEQRLIEQLAEGVLAVAREAGLRQARVDLQARRHPADSRLAVAWVERFEAYSRLWTPLWAMAAELQAAVRVSRDQPSAFPPWDPDGVEAESQRIAVSGGYDPVNECRGYARSALYRYAEFHLELKRFLSRYGGLFLFSSTEVEETVADALYLVSWNAPGTEQAHAFLRRTLADSRHEEQDHFEQVLKATDEGEYLLTRWYDFAAECSCQDIDNGDRDEGETVPTCKLHATVHYARVYCDVVDEEWLKIADWYRIGSTPPRGLQPGQPHEQYMKKMEEKRKVRADKGGDVP